MGTAMLEKRAMAACLRWHTAQQNRLSIGAELRLIRESNKEKPVLFHASDLNASRRLTEAKRAERAALRKLAALCLEMRAGHQQADNAIDAFVKLTC